MNNRLLGKVAIITGSTLGLGKSAALLFAREGASVVICDRGRVPERHKIMIEESTNLSGEILYQKCDIMNKDDILSLAQFTLKRFNKIDIMVNNAIIDNPSGPIEKVSLTDWEDGIFCHMTAPFLFCQQVIPTMIKQGGGSIINITSGNALFGSLDISSYGPAKAGLINFTASVAVTYGKYGIRANSLCPARMLTEKKMAMLKNNPKEVRRQKFVYPLGSPAQTKQVADALIFLASDESSAITGHNLVADRGVAAFNPLNVPVKIEADIRDKLEAQGSGWLADEE